MVESFKDRRNTSFTLEDAKKAATGDEYHFEGVKLAKIEKTGCDICCFNESTTVCRQADKDLFNITSCSLHQYIRIDDLDWTPIPVVEEPVRRVPDRLPINTVTFDGKYKTIKETAGCKGCVFSNPGSCNSTARKVYALECRTHDNLIFVKNDSNEYRPAEDLSKPLVIKRDDGTAIINFRNGKVIESKLDPDYNGCAECWFNDHCESICSEIADKTDCDCVTPNVIWVPVSGFSGYRENWKDCEEVEEERIIDDTSNEDVEEDFDNSELIGDELEMTNGGTVVIERDHGECDGCYFNNGSCKRDSLVVDPPNDCDNIIFVLGDEPDPDIGTRVTFPNGDSALCSYSDDGCEGCCFDNSGCSEEIGCSDVHCHQRRYSEYETAEVTAKVRASNKMPEHGVVFDIGVDKEKFSERGHKVHAEIAKFLSKAYPAPLIFKKEKRFSI